MKRYTFLKAYEPGIRATDANAGRVSIRCRPVGELVITSGKLVACDPAVFEEITPFTQEVPPGRYPVILALVRYERDLVPYEYVASAMLRFNDRAAVRLERAIAGASSVEYDVETGTGCFMDKDAAMRLSHTSIRYGDWNALSWEAAFDESTGLNVIAFSTGFGDGSYCSCWGYDAQGNPVYLATDFGVLSDATFL